MAEDILRVDNLKTYYETREKERVYAVDDVSFTLKEGKVLGIAGESGCGKSTLAVSLMGLFNGALTYDSGDIRIRGQETARMPKAQKRVQVLGKKIAYIPQSAMNTLNPTLKIKHFIFDIMKEHHPKMKKKEVFEMAKKRFEALNLDTRVLNAYPSQLSGGMKQRTVIAISTIMNPEIVVADEPTSALDVSTQKVVMKLLKSLLKKGIIKSMIFITHELPLLYHIADDIMIMYAGKNVEYASSEEVIFDPLHPYSIELMTSIVVPEVGFKDKELASIPGTPPDLKNKITGCRFADRCKYATKRCIAADLPMLQVGSRLYRCNKDLNEIRLIKKTN